MTLAGMRSLVGICVVGGLGASGFGASAQAAQLAKLSTFSPISARSGVAVWSKRHGDRFVLVAHRNGRSAQLPVASRRVPFDSQLGTNGKKRLVLTYSRCRREPTLQPDRTFGFIDYSTGSGCSVYEYNFGERTERRIRIEDRSAVWPAESAGHLAYFALAGSGYAKLKVITAHRVLSLGMGSITALGPTDEIHAAFPTGLAFDGRHIAFTWAIARNVCRPGGSSAATVGATQTEVWVASLPRAPRRKEVGCSGDDAYLFNTPTFAATARARYFRLGRGATPPAAPAISSLRQLDLSTGRVSVASAVQAVAGTSDGSASYYEIPSGRGYVITSGPPARFVATATGTRTSRTPPRCSSRC